MNPSYDMKEQLQAVSVSNVLANKQNEKVPPKLMHAWLYYVFKH